MTTSRFTNGVTNVAKRNVLGQYKSIDPTINHQYFDDFDYYNSNDWVVTEVGVATQVLADEDGGVLRITNAAADNDSSFSQKVGESFLLEANKKAYFKARFLITDATQSDLIIGLQITDTTPLSVSDGIFFQKDDGDANLDFHVKKEDTETVASAITTISDNTYITVGFFYDGKGKIYYYAGTDSNNPAVIGSIETTSINFPTTEDLTISYGIQNGEAVSKAMDIDYIFASKER